MFGRKLRRVRVRRRSRPKRSAYATNHYRTHKEAARTLIHSRLEHYNEYYGFTYGRVSIKSQRRCWGSCSSLGNLNFNYRILFLPPELQDYIIVHELCHLKEMNHGQEFWQLVAEQYPAYQEAKQALHMLEKGLKANQLALK